VKTALHAETTVTSIMPRSSSALLYVRAHLNSFYFPLFNHPMTDIRENRKLLPTYQHHLNKGKEMRTDSTNINS
jgi:hypothetical protein